MPNVVIFSLLLLAAVNSDIASSKQIYYQESDEIFPNPERGFTHTMNVFSGGAPLSNDQIKNLRDESVTMIVRVFYLDWFKNSAISDDQLNLIRSDLNLLRSNGLKIIIRFAYTDAIGGADAPLSFVLQHIDQLKSIFEEHQDVIAFVQAGFIGAWGEWHSSSNGLTTTENQKLVLDKLLSSVPQGIMVQIRTPGYKQAIFNTTNPIGADLGFTNTSIARVGQHNDCFLTGGMDTGTYTQLPEQKYYIRDEANFIPTGGETCVPMDGYNPNCNEARNEMRMLKWTYLNLDYYEPTITGFKNGGCFDEFQRMMGYRHVLLSADLPEQASGTIQVRLNIANKGFAPVYNKKIMTLILKSGSGQTYELPFTYDIRNIKPEMTGEINENLSLSGVPAGGFEVFLKVSDRFESIKNRSEYSIRLANNNVWVTENGGMNNLSHSVSIG